MRREGRKGVSEEREGREIRERKEDKGIKEKG